MDLFMQANSGLYRRIGYTFDFSDYAPVELAEILNSIVRGAGFKLAPSLSANSFQRLSNVIEAKTLEEAREMMNGGPPLPVREGRRGDSREAGDQSMLLRRTEAQLRTAKSEVQLLHAQLRAVKAVSAQNVAWKEEAMPEYSVRFCCRYSFGCLCHFGARMVRACSEACRCPKRHKFPQVSSTPVIHIRESDPPPELLSP